MSHRTIIAALAAAGLLAGAVVANASMAPQPAAAPAAPALAASAHSQSQPQAAPAATEAAAPRKAVRVIPLYNVPAEQRGRI